MLLVPQCLKVVRKFTPPEGEGGYLRLDLGDEVLHQYSGASSTGDMDWLYGQTADQRRQGWFPWTAVGHEVVTEFVPPPGEGGYLNLAPGDKILVAYIGSSASGDAGWLYGSFFDGHSCGWFPASAMEAKRAEEEIAVQVQDVLPVIGFYGHSPSVCYKEFSNFFCMRRPYDFVFPAFASPDGFPRSVSCQFAEKAIMMTKAALMGDRTIFDQMLQANSPHEVKRLGRRVRNFNEELWQRHLNEVAFEAVRQKFESDRNLAEVLLSTGSATLAEATRTDTIWGIGIDVGDPRIQDPTKWKGRNVLGEALMRTRRFLVSSTASASR